MGIRIDSTLTGGVGDGGGTVSTRIGSGVVRMGGIAYCEL
jgi:hypothetical protein